jgi:hypothetical protein
VEKHACLKVMRFGLAERNPQFCKWLSIIRFLMFVRILIILNSKNTVSEFPILRSEGGRHLLNYA